MHKDEIPDIEEHDVHGIGRYSGTWKGVRIERESRFSRERIVRQEDEGT